MNKMTKLLMKTVIGMVIGLACYGLGFMDTMNPLIPMLVFAGFPSGWMITGKVFLAWMTGPVGVIIFALRVIASMLIGWIALPVELIGCVLAMRHENSEI